MILKSRNLYEFGVKVGLAITLKGNLIGVARNFPGNPYDGYTMHEQIGQSAILMDRCHLKGAEGDALLAVLCAADYNIRRLLRMIARKGLGLLLCLLQVSGLTGLFEKLAEIFGLNRLQNSDQRWALA